MDIKNKDPFSVYLRKNRSYFYTN